MTITHSSLLRTALPVFTALLVGQGVLVSAAPAGSSIQGVTLTTRDVTAVYGHGFKSFLSGVISNQDVASAMKSAGQTTGISVTNAGRVTGYNSVWFRGNKTASLSITNSISLYKSSGFPHAALGKASRQTGVPKGFAFHFSPLHGLGDEAYLLTVHTHGTAGLGVTFRRGAYLVEIMIGARHGTISTSSMEKLAAIEDQRIQAHG
jgi:hypothetical protein